MAERMSIADRISGFVFYIQARLPEHLAETLLQLGASGNELGIQQFCADEKISGIAEEAVVQTYRWNNMRADDFLNFVQANHGGRIITFALLDALWQQYKLGNAVHRLDQPEVTQAELDAMSDEEVESTLEAARRLRAGL